MVPPSLSARVSSEVTPVSRSPVSRLRIGSAGSRMWGVNVATLSLWSSALASAWVAVMPRLKKTLNGGRLGVRGTSLLTRGGGPQRCQPSAGRAAHRHNAVLVGVAALGKQVLPPELLDRGLLGGEFLLLVLIFEARQRRQHRLLVAGADVDLVNGKAETAIDVFVECPGDDGNVIVGKSNCGHRNNPAGKFELVSLRCSKLSPPAK